MDLKGLLVPSPAKCQRSLKTGIKCILWEQKFLNLPREKTPYPSLEET